MSAHHYLYRVRCQTGPNNPKAYVERGPLGLPRWTWQETAPSAAPSTWSGGRRSSGHASPVDLPALRWPAADPDLETAGLGCCRTDPEGRCHCCRLLLA